MATSPSRPPRAPGAPGTPGSHRGSVARAAPSTGLPPRAGRGWWWQVLWPCRMRPQLALLYALLYALLLSALSPATLAQPQDRAGPHLPDSARAGYGAGPARRVAPLDAEADEPPCPEPSGAPARPRFPGGEYDRSGRSRPPLATPLATRLATPLAPVLAPLGMKPAPFPHASPRSDDAAPTGLRAGAATRRGYYGHEVGYGSYFPIGLDPLTILAGLAFLAFIIQTLYLLLYKHYGLGLGVGAGAGVGIGPLSADRHQRDEQQAWANTVASRIDATAQAFESGNRTAASNGSAASGHPGGSQHLPADGEQVDAAELEPGSGSADAARRLGRRRTAGPSPLDALLAVVRRSWSAPAHSCGPSWLCRLVHLARMLTEPLAPLAGAAARARASPPSSSSPAPT